MRRIAGVVASGAIGCSSVSGTDLRADARPVAADSTTSGVDAAPGSGPAREAAAEATADATTDAATDAVADASTDATGAADVSLRDAAAEGAATAADGDVTLANDAGPARPVAITAGLFSTCALLSDGTAKCWGYNAYGQLGDGTMVDSRTPVVVQGLHGATSIDGCAGYHVCARLSTGKAQCWGSGYLGSLGNGATLDSATIKTVANLTSVAQVSTGDNGSCAALLDGTAACWGAVGTGADPTVPSAVPGLAGVVSVTTGSGDPCALLAGGTVSCWGNNQWGQVGVDASSTPVTTPSAVAGLTHVTSVAAGSEEVCALLADGAVACWGFNGYGQLGDGTTAASSTPVAVRGIAGAKAVAVGGYYACALLADGSVACWGDNAYGTLGDGTTTSSPAPVAVSGLDHVAAIATGIEHACALLDDGGVRCWGADDRGELGAPPTSTADATGSAFSLVPVAVQW
jgi:alpha-tubulin suppressor-like RCC1 family protein